VTEPVDWELAAATGARLAPNGPDSTSGEAAEAVAQLRELALQAREPVREVTRLTALSSAPVAVVDRAEWIRANVGAFRTVTAPISAKLSPGRVHSVASRVNALQLGVGLAWMSGKVLGQFEALPPAGEESRLLLVAPNIVAAERSMAADPRDFRMWVCLHEETHRVQFGAVAWLPDFFAGAVASLVADLDASPAELLRRATSGLRSSGGEDDGLPMMAMLQSPQQRAVMQQILGLMSLLEGHADWVMDNAAPQVVPSAAELRSAFETRRRGSGPIDLLLRRLLGVEAKMAQYREGARFVRIVVDRVGLAGFNHVWDSPDHLPSLAEIRSPQRWIGRVHPDAV
jgi:coenzyme F420 biosynthesis associated uncharacterized protein